FTLPFYTFPTRRSSDLPGVHPQTARVDIRSDIFVFQIVADIPVKFPVVEIAGVTLLGTPDLFGGFQVPAKGRHPRRTVHGGVVPVLGAGGSMEDAVGIGEKITEAVIAQDLIVPRIIGAFGQPNPPWGPPETTGMVCDGGVDLGADGLPVQH